MKNLYVHNGFVKLKYHVTQVLLAAIVGLLTFCSCCAQSIKTDEADRLLSELDNGKVTGNVYENKLLGMKIPFPKNMAPDSIIEMESIMKEAIEKLKQGRAEDKRYVDEMIRKDRIVFSLDLPASEDSLGGSLTLTLKKDETNEELRPMVERTVRFFTESQQQKIVENLSEVTIGTSKVYTFLISQDVEGGAVFSRLFTGRRNGYLFTLSASYADKKGKSEMDAVLKAIEVK